MSKTSVCCILFICIANCLAEWVSLGDKHSFVCSRNRNNITAINWIKTTNGFEDNLFFCDLTPINKSCSPAQENLPYHATTFLEGDSIKSILEINRITLDLHKSQWKCVIGVILSETTVYIFDLFVFALAENLICFNAVLVKEVNVNFQCTTEKIAPEAICEFFVKSNNTEPVYLKNQEITYTNLPSHFQGYNRTECTMTVAGTLLGPGTHAVFVVIYPNITSNVTVGMKRASNYTDAITISYPKALLTPNCQGDNYIKENETIYCTCYNNNTSFFPTQVFWLMETSINGTVHFVARRPSTVGESKKFTCFLSNTLNWTDTIEYRPNVVYGPDIVILKLNYTELFFCEQKGANVTGTCLISDSNPEPMVFFKIGNSSIQLKPGEEKHEYNFNTQISSPGNFKSVCSANNIVFGEIYSEMSQTIKVNDLSQILLFAGFKNTTQVIKPESTLSVSEGVLTITCQSTVFPLHTSIVLLCGDKGNETKDRDDVLLMVNISKETNNLHCFCTFWPKSNCQRKAYYFNIKLNEGADVEGMVFEPTLIVGWLMAGIFCVILFVLITPFMIRRHTRQKRRNDGTNYVDEIQDYSHLSGQQENVTSDHYNYSIPTFVTTNSTHVDLTTSLDGSTQDRK